MPRRPREAIGGMLFHVLNRAAGRSRMFHSQKDYAAFEAVIERVFGRVPVRLLS